MLSRFISLLFSLSATAPILISIAYIQADVGEQMQVAVIAFLGCILFGALAVQIIRKAAVNLEVMAVTFKKVKSANKDVISFYIAYVLPLLFKGAGLANAGAFFLGVAMLIFVIWATKSMQVNPVLGLLGYHFYEAETEDGITYLLITTSLINNAKKIKNVCQLTNHGLLDLSDKTNPL